MGRESVAKSTKWSLMSLVSTQVIRITFTVILAPILGPTNFGIVGQATIYIAFAAVFMDLGLAAVLIQRPNLDRRVVGTVTAVNLVVVGVLVTFTLAFADLWSGIFDTPELAGVLRVLSLTFVFIGLAVVPGALLARRLDFKLLGIAQVTSSVIGGVAGVVAALNGAQYWALVVQTLLRDAVYVLMLLAVTGRPIVTWSTEALRSIARMSRNVYGSQLLGYFNSHADDFLVAWRLGAAPLANYALSYRILQLPVQALGQTANRLVLPIFSQLQGDASRQARYYFSTITSLSLVVIPTMLIVALSAPVVVTVFFGPAWEGAIRPTQILAIASIVWTLMTVNSPVLIANDRPQWLFRYSLVNTVALVGAAAVGLRYGIAGVAWALLIAGIPLALILLRLTGKVIPIGARSYARAIAPASIGAIAMLGVWILAGPTVGSWFGDLGGIGAMTVLTISVFVGIVWLGWRETFRQQVSFVRAMIGVETNVSEPA
ncbi:MAG: lipopolysaccharide biosynthesis protein [Acidimicrobiales bacterium]